MDGEYNKMRIQKFSSNWELLEDKLYKQSYELKSGPKNSHEGPIKIEFTLSDKSDVELAILYLNRLSGILPQEPKVQKDKQIKGESSKEYDLNLLTNSILDGAYTNQDELIKYLRFIGFVFTTRDLLSCLNGFENIEFEDESYADKYQYMVRLIRESKSNPSMDKYDPRLLIGIKIYGKRKDLIYVYNNGKLAGNIKIKVPESATEVFENQKLFIFPEYMTEKDKDKFRKEYRKMESDNSLQPSEFFIRWVKWVKMSKVLDNFKDIMP